jgi:hypothetical protein
VKSPRKIPKKAASVVVDEAELGDRGWQTIDLSTPLSVSSVLGDARTLRRSKKWTSNTSLSLRWRAMVERGLHADDGAARSCQSGRKVPSARRVPDHDIVDVGRTSLPAATAASPMSAESGCTSSRDTLRQILLLIALVVIMAGSYYLGQTWPRYNVIVVPAPISDRSVVT